LQAGKTQACGYAADVEETTAGKKRMRFLTEGKEGWREPPQQRILGAVHRSYALRAAHAVQVCEAIVWL